MSATFPPFGGNSGSGGGSDGANRLYHIAGITPVDRVSNQVVFEMDGELSDVGIFDLTGATHGDSLTIYIENDLYSYGTFAFVIPLSYDGGFVRVISKANANYFLVTADSVGAPFEPIAGRAPGVCQIFPGTTDYLVVSTLTADGNKLVQVNSLRAIVKPAFALSERLPAPAPGASVEFEFPGSFNAPALLDYFFPNSVRIYADQLVDCKLEVFGWDATTLTWGDVAQAEATWTTQPDGAPNFSSINLAIDMPKMPTGSGMRSVVPADSLIRVTLPSFPNSAPAMARVCLAVSTMEDYA